MKNLSQDSWTAATLTRNLQNTVIFSTMVHYLSQKHLSVFSNIYDLPIFPLMDSSLITSSLPLIYILPVAITLMSMINMCKQALNMVHETKMCLQ
jgi:hypothetical protein